MLTLNEKQARLCVRALSKYSAQIIERHAEFGDGTDADFQEAMDAANLAANFDKEVKNA